MAEKNQQEITKVFSIILEKVSEKITSTDFVFAFSSVELISLQDHKLVIGVPADFVKGLIEKHKKTILEISKEIAQIQEIEITITDQENASHFFSGAQKKSKPNNVDSKEEYTSSASSHITIKSPDKTSSSNLNPNFSFDNFVVGSSNHFAHSMATVVANNPGTAHNPCLFYSSVGLGKTHLLQAIGNHIQSTQPNLNIHFFSTEEFLSQYVQSISTNKANEFRNKTRKLDVIIIDDIQFCSGKPALQEQWYYLFNQLGQENKQMVFASDRPPHEIKDIEERLLSRFRSKMIADIQTPTPEMALGIIDKAIQRNMNIHNKDLEAYDILPEVIDLIVEQLRFNTRDMLGAIDRVVGYQEITKTKFSVAQMREWLPTYSPEKNAPTQHTTDTILKIVADYFNVSTRELKARNKKHSITYPRYIAMYILKQMTRYSHTEIGSIFDVSYVSVSNAIAKIEREIEVKLETSEIIGKLQTQIKKESR